jgi:hypothetical protein
MVISCSKTQQQKQEQEKERLSAESCVTTTYISGGRDTENIYCDRPELKGRQRQDIFTRGRREFPEKCT